MIKLTINNTEVSVPKGISVHGAAQLKGIRIPTLCYREGKPHMPSCMVCMVKDSKTGKLFASCAVKAEEGVNIITNDEEVLEARKMALELLLSDHVGDCEAPCQVTCPAHMDIPLMNRYLAEGDFQSALKVVKKDIALPAVFGRICPAPCEGACRRKSVDSAVSICLLKRSAGDDDLESDPWLPEKAPSSGKKVAIIGAGPAGLAAAYYLTLKGHQCDVYDRGEFPGGTLWSEVISGKLPEDVLKKEIGIIEQLGAWFYPNTFVDETKFNELKKKFDAVLVTTGSQEEKEGEDFLPNFGLATTSAGLDAHKTSYTTSEKGVFAAGSAVRKSKLAIRCLGQGKEAAWSIDQYLSGKDASGEPFLFNSRFGKLLPEEITEYLKESYIGPRQEPSTAGSGFSKEQVMEEAGRCLHCDCRAASDCELRLLSHEYNANQKHYWSEDRHPVLKNGFGESNESIQGKFVIYEPTKCIKCGKCVYIAEEHKEKFGLSFIGRGFDMVIGVPFTEALNNGLEQVAEQVVAECPTGALALK